MQKRGVKIRAVEPDSPAHRAGLAPGDEIVAINGHPVPDELALRFHLAETEDVALDVIQADGGEIRVTAEFDDESGFGVEVEDFRTRTCNNACLFCFVNQLPPGVRQTLKIKDDDFRLSFLHGNYITLTNLAEKDLDRIVKHALSPIFVSVHATDPALRTRIMGRKKVDDLAGKLRRLIDGGIRIHAQIVLIPEINDGEPLERTVSDLYGWRPGVDSVAIVPLGLSEYRAGEADLVPVTPDFCRRVIDQVTPWQVRFRQETGRGFAYLGDEFYIQGGVPIPAAESYDDFAQIEDGIGMVRCFLDEFDTHLNRRRKRLPGLHGTLATGTLFYPFLKDCAAALNRKLGAELKVIEVPNRFMGRNITVAGLLAGRDFLEALSGRPLGDFVIVPNEAISQVEGIFVDDISLADLAQRLHTPVIPSGRTMGDFFRLLGCRMLGC